MLRSHGASAACAITALMVRTIVFSVGLLGMWDGVARAADPSGPLVVAHRGLLKHAPENTLANFRACLALRVGFEFDVQRTKDGRLVCIHDDTVDRTTNGKGKVTEFTLPALRELDAGGWFDPRFAGQRVPTVDEVLALIRQEGAPGMLFAVDLKAAGVEKAVVRLADDRGVLDRLLFIGTTISMPDVREKLREANTKAQTAVVANKSTEFAAALEAPNADWIYFRYLPAHNEVIAVRKAGKRAFIAGVSVSGNVPENWQQAAEAGIDGILTDFPLELLDQLRQPIR